MNFRNKSSDDEKAVEINNVKIMKVDHIIYLDLMVNNKLSLITN